MCDVTLGKIAIKLVIALYVIKILDNFVFAQSKGEALLPHRPGDTQRTVFVPPNSTCKPPRANCDLINKFFHTLDGSCNNLEETSWGQAGTLYIGMFPAHYKDGRSQMPVSCLDGSPLPDARVLRTTFLTDLSVPDNTRNIFFYAIGQMLTHDFTSFNSARLTASCCTPDGKPVTPTPPGCIPILVPKDDPFYSKFGITCLPMTRANCSYDAKCELNKPSRPFNFVTHVIDGSIVYSNNKNISDTLRTMQGGRMRKWMNDFNQMFFSMTTACPAVSSDCWVVPDQRITACPELSLSVLTFFRFHDTMCSVFANHAKWLNDQETFDCVRRIVIACFQMIVYNEYLPLLLGPKACKKHGLLPLRQGYTTYNSKVNPSTFVECTLCSRSGGHSSVVESVKYRATNNSITSYQLENQFLDQDFLMEGTTCPHLMQSYQTTTCNKADEHDISALTNHLFQEKGAGFGLDLASTDLQRSRDMGMPDYCSLRKALNLSPVNRFEDLLGILAKPENMRKLKQMYKCPKDLDGHLMTQLEAREDPESTYGPVCTEILARAYKNYKDGDRLYFEHGGPTAICPEALQIIRQIRMCHVISWANPTTSDMKVALNAFKVPSPSNPLKSCAEMIRAGPNMGRLAWLMAQQAFPKKSG